MNKYTKIEKCRICGNTNLISVVNLGEQTLTGVFPKSLTEEITTGPLELVKCHGDEAVCGLLQLHHSYQLDEMYGDNYGYRSGLNISMVNHLNDIVCKAVSFITLKENDLIIDIGSNDGTLLKQYQNGERYLRVGIDPTSDKFKEFYPETIQNIPDFFSSKLVKEKFNEKKAKIITSISMFYDLEEPISFVEQVYDVLDNDGIWIFEQSYMPLMIERNAYDTICHEHLEYYGLQQILWMFKKVGFKIIDLELNDTNGGSFKITAAKKTSGYNEANETVQSLLQKEKTDGYHTLEPYYKFRNTIEKHKNDLIALINKIKKSDKTIFGYGASTKGNVILQYCKITPNEIPYIAEVNENKFGSYTPNTNIPIISEGDAKKMKPDYFMVLPWHFKDNFLQREKEYLNEGGKLIFPLPEIEVIE